MKSAGGIRDYLTIADQLSHNLKILESGEWERAMKECNRLVQPVPRECEAEVADYIDERFKGFGPKQARNLLQALGMTRYEIPIDSRMIKWLNTNGFPVTLSASALADVNYYRFVSDGIQELCDKAEVYPCLFDAAVFMLGGDEEFTKAQFDWA